MTVETDRRDFAAAYAMQTHSSPHFLVRYPHRQRLRRAAELVVEGRPNSLLDYGTGDCQFLLDLIAKAQHVPATLVAYNPPGEVTDVATRLREHGAESISYCQDFDQLRRTQFDTIVCLSVLEHLSLRERERFYALCHQALSPTGRCIIEVPIEVGPSLILKEWGRTRLKDRAAEYSARELVRLGVGAYSFDSARFSADTDCAYIGTHKGFDYRLLRQELEAHFELLDTFGTPFSRLPPWLINQEVFFVVAAKLEGSDSFRFRRS